MEENRIQEDEDSVPVMQRLRAEAEKMRGNRTTELHQVAVDTIHRSVGVLFANLELEKATDGNSPGVEATRLL
jgi:hypothetical protein